MFNLLLVIRGHFSPSWGQSLVTCTGLIVQCLFHSMRRGNSTIHMLDAFCSRGQYFQTLNQQNNQVQALQFGAFFAPHGLAQLIILKTVRSHSHLIIFFLCCLTVLRLLSRLIKDCVTAQNNVVGILQALLQLALLFSTYVLSVISA